MFRKYSVQQLESVSVYAILMAMLAAVALAMLVVLLTT
jgi:hypothetical protein